MAGINPKGLLDIMVKPPKNTKMTFEESKKIGPKPSAYEREKARVYATGNKWAIENFHATHD